MLIGGSSHQRIMTMVLSIKQGVTIGDVTFDVLNLVYALLIVIITLSILPFIQNQLVSNWLTHSNLSRGAKEATQKLVGYAGVAIAVFWAFHVAGVNFKNFAIIAGALSVGIGFGLKNIVSNFISGLILLFERPISRGDWVMVGATEGHVKDISIRSTTIQTFQQADVIVPNSELISNQVTNWMLSNTIGRLQIPIGVAYGSDVSLVMETLEEIANRHPEVISDHPDYSAYVLFLGFGESALNFELRCFLRNIGKRSSVLSAINQGIDREFRKANIEIPFPQRVVHMRHEAMEAKPV
jgi:small-conductance mechanosensitive channel